MCEENISSFITEESLCNYSQNTLDHRRRDLMNLYNWLPEDKEITKDRLAGWRQNLVDKGYTYNTQANYVKSVNRYLRFLGKEEWCFRKGKSLDLKGKTFGYLTALEPTEKRYRKDIIWLCQCKCGNTAEVPATRLVSGNTLSCGCLKADRLHTGNKYIDGTELRSVMEDKIFNPYNPSGYVGVTPSRGMWMARISYKKKTYYLGRYGKVEDAARAYSRAKELVLADARALEQRWDEIHKDDPELPHRSNMVPFEPSPNYTEERSTTPVPQVLRTNNTSGVAGVFKKRDKWAARITYKKKNYYLGYFADKEDAITARKEAEKLLLVDTKQFIEKYSSTKDKPAEIAEGSLPFRAST